MSLRELELACGVSRGQLSMIERGLMQANDSQRQKLEEALLLPDGSLTTRTMLVLK